MGKLLDYWTARNPRQRAILVAAFVGTLLAVTAFAMLAGRTKLALLYSGLDASQAGEVVAEIERRGVVHEVRGEAIWVAATQRDRLRMELAASGMPSGGGQGYELLDGMSGFGTTSQMFDAAYWRAKEGELARTILALPNVRAARVHLAAPTGLGYRRGAAATASVTVTTRGAAVSPEQARSLQFLVSSGVPGMDAASVTVIDSQRGVVSPSDSAAGSDRETAMKDNIERILAPHVGRGNAIVELHLDLETDREQLTEQRFDPRERALISEEVEETTDQNTNQAGAGPVTAASNLPDSSAKGTGDQSRSDRSETRSRSNYEVSQTTREVIRQPGAVKRLTVAVLVNGVPQIAADGTTTIVPRSEAELTAIRELVASASGFDEARGDQLTVKSLPFAAMTDAGTLAEAGGWQETLAVGELLRLALVGIFALAFALLVLRPALRARAVAEPAAAALAAPAAVATATPLPGLAMATPLEEPADTGGFAMLPMATPDFSFDTPALGGGGTGSAVERLKSLMLERHEESVKVLASWIGESREAAR